MVELTLPSSPHRCGSFFLYSYASKVRFMAGVMRRLVSARNVLRKDI